jgi:pyruvate-formate lyase-activating enzyme
MDPFGRHVSYLRVSVTDRCDLRCVYCMAEDMTFLPKAEILTLEELERLSAAFIATGVDKIRLTGGEPLVRKNVMSLIRGLGQRIGPGGLRELTLTTNAQPALMAVSMAVVRVLEREGGFRLADKVALVAGHSLGEYSALTAAGALPVAVTARLLRLRDLLKGGA